MEADRLEPPPEWEGARLVFLDCDSTLSRIEGVDELARRRGLDLGALTRGAMDGRVPLETVYRERLERIRPAAEDLAWLARRYEETATPGARELVAGLREAGVALRLLSGGLLPALRPFARFLGLPETAVLAVPYTPPPAGAPEEAWQEAIEAACRHPLARNGGKPLLVRREREALGLQRRAVALVGDGVSDLEAAPETGLFVGFGGAAARPAVARAASLWLRTPDLARLLPVLRPAPRARL